MDPKDYLMQVAKISRSRPSGYRYGSIEAAVLDLGQEFLSVKSCSKLGQLGRCYENAAKLCLEDPNLTYCEGYATFLGIPILHAWAFDGQTVLDPTWPDAEKCAYFGIMIPRNVLHETLIRRRRYGVLDDPESRFPILKTGFLDQAEDLV